MSTCNSFKGVKGQVESDARKGHQAKGGLKRENTPALKHGEQAGMERVELGRCREREEEEWGLETCTRGSVNSSELLEVGGGQDWWKKKLEELIVKKTRRARGKGMRD